MKKSSTTYILILSVLAGAFSLWKILSGFSNVDEADIVFDIYKLLANLAGERNLSKLIWIDSGINGPLHYYLYAMFTVPLSFILRMPLDMAMKLTAAATIPFTIGFFYKFADRVLAYRGETAPSISAALPAAAILLCSPFFLGMNLIAIGEPWYSLFLSISFYYLLKDTGSKASASQFRKNIYLSFLFFALGMLAKYTFVPLIFIHITVIIFRRKEIKPRISDIILGGLILLSGFLPLILSVFISGPSFLIRFQQLDSGKTGMLPGLWPTILSVLDGTGPAGIFFLLSGITVLLLKRKHSNPLLRSIALGFLAALLFYALVKTPSGRYRYPLIFPLALLGGYGVLQLSRILMRIGWKTRTTFHLSMILIITIFAIRFFSNYQPALSAPDRMAAKYVINRSGKNDVILGINSSSFYLFSKRPLAINPLLDTLKENKDGTLSIQYRMNGLRQMNLDETTAFLITEEDDIKNVNRSLFEKSFVKEKTFGRFRIYRIKQYKPRGERDPWRYSDYSLKSITGRVRRYGVRQPGSLIERGW